MACASPGRRSVTAFPQSSERPSGRMCSWLYHGDSQPLFRPDERHIVCPDPENSVKHLVLDLIPLPKCSPGENDVVVLIHSIPLAEALSCSPVTWEGRRYYVPYNPIHRDGGLSSCRHDSPIPQKLPVIRARDSSPTEVFDPFRVKTGFTHKGGTPRYHEYH
jgi:hypothetical protein